VGEISLEEAMPPMDETFRVDEMSPVGEILLVDEMPLVDEMRLADDMAVVSVRQVLEMLLIEKHRLLQWLRCLENSKDCHQYLQGHLCGLALASCMTALPGCLTVPVPRQPIRLNRQRLTSVRLCRSGGNGRLNRTQTPCGGGMR